MLFLASSLPTLTQSLVSLDCSPPGKRECGWCSGGENLDKHLKQGRAIAGLFATTPGGSIGDDARASGTARMRRTLLVPFLAYRLQERVFDGLELSTRAELRRIARPPERGSDSVKPVLRPRVKPGTPIIREWQGKTCEVSVTEFGFEYADTNYRSLSQIARWITGMRWSERAFFD